MNFFANSTRLLRKLDHVLLWMLSNDPMLLQCSLCAKQRKFQWLKPLQNKKGQKNLGYPRKKQSFYKEKDCFFFSSTPHFFGPSYFEAALAMFCLYTRPAQAKIQILTVICSIVKLIPWSEINLSHLYPQIIYLGADKLLGVRPIPEAPLLIGPRNPGLPCTGVPTALVYYLAYHWRPPV